jgi:protocatechuate 3,4-dioxygenase beta subunit
MDQDDVTIGQVLSRREALAVLGATGTLLLLGASSARRSSAGGADPRLPCVVRPASTPGPYYVDEKLERSDIRNDPTDGTVKAGALLALSITVSHIAKGACAPLKGALVDLWQCDAGGVYSDAVDPRYFNTTGKKFLRGYQVADQNGVASFITIYPGWYPQRTPHIHYKIRSPASAQSPYHFTGQLYFDEGLSDQVYAQIPYSGRGKRSVSNITDRIFNQDRGRQTILRVSPAKDGYRASFDVALNLG